MSLVLSPGPLRTPPNLRRALPWIAGPLVGAVVCLGLLAVTGRIVLPWSGGDSGDAKEEPPKEEGIVKFPESRWPSAGVTIAPVTRAPFVERIRRTGRITLNEDRVAHLAPPVEGIVREVNVRLGQSVKAGEVLAVLDSREVGQARLELAKARVARAHSEAQHAWVAETSKNVEELIQAMQADVPIADLEKRFKDRPIGEWRQQLFGAYAKRDQLKKQYDAAKMGAGDFLAQWDYLRLKSEQEAAAASYRALCEELRFQAPQQVRTATQKLQDARTTEAVARAQLTLFGIPASEVGDVEALAVDGKVSHYQIRAPFAATVLEKHAVLSERVGPQLQMFVLTDLSTVWVQADVFEADLPLVRGLVGKKIKCRSTVGDGLEFEAEVFTTGDVLDKNTRTLPLTATAANPDKTLKGGQFVEIELDRPGGEALQVPEAAVLRLGTQPFVFVHEGGERFRKADVTLGRTSGEQCEITAGLSAGDRIAVGGVFLLKSELLRDQLTAD
jgi:cobalt-zinc-cadmium efflux system membrane fusion protein